MKLENTTPLAATLNVSTIPESDLRLGCITAKATYCFDGQGAVMLDLEDPFPIFADDVETDLGLLPHDQFPRQDPAFEVILLGAAHAPGGRPVERMTVSLSVGDVRRELLVTGDRTWIGQGEDAVITRPAPFSRMPLTWDRAYGGTAEVLIDVESPVDVSHPLNPEGLGFDPDPVVRQLADHFTPPEGFPCTDYVRRLPNVEAPDERVSSWTDEPETPACWATVPQMSTLQLRRSVELSRDADAMLSQLSETDAPFPLEEGLYHRAPPEWVVPVPPPETPVVLDGLHPQGRLELCLPPLRVLADYRVGDDRGACELAPQLMLLLPEQQQLYLLFRHIFLMAFEPGQIRTMRLSLAEGWFQQQETLEEG